MDTNTLTPAEVAALHFGHDHVRRRVDVEALTIRTRGTVRSDPFPGARDMHVDPGESVRCQLNQYGAVSAVARDGGWLGIKPREFDFVCPIATGRTHLDGHGSDGNGTWHIDVDPHQVLVGADGSRWTIAGVMLVRCEVDGWQWLVRLASEVRS